LTIVLSEAYYHRKMSKEHRSHENLFYQWWNSPLEEAKKAENAFKKFHNNVKQTQTELWKTHRTKAVLVENFATVLPSELDIFAEGPVTLVFSYDNSRKDGVPTSKISLMRTSGSKSGSKEELIDLEVMGIPGPTGDFQVKFSKGKEPLVHFYTSRKALVNFIENLNYFLGKRQN